MVQRKLPSKLDHIMVNSKPLLPSLKPSSLLPQHQDVKKKKMKKSGKTTTFENFRSPPLRKPPPPLTPPQRSSPVRASPSSTPNYMKSTSSSDARKERSPHKSSSGSKSGQNPARASARATSLRALTKAPSFKPARARASSKKCSQVVLCEDLDAQRATCSSTLKDSKFPCYLELSPGGTESQGTSAMKVCPYTYCSLNGHHRLPLPPLKCFVSARRRALKTQRSFKIGCLSPRRAKPPAGEEENMDFSVEIYCKERAGEDDEEEEEGEDIHPASMAAEELRYECLSEENHDSEDSDMEGMEDSALFIDAGVSDSICHNKEEEEEETNCIIDEISDEKSFDEESMSSGAWLSYDDDDDDTQSSISCPESSSFCVYVEETTQVSNEEICRENQESNDSNDSICSDCVQELHNVDEELMVEVKKMAKADNKSGNQILDLDELPNLRRTGKNNRETEEEELREFNPRGPNFLPLEPDPEAERVNLKHQMMEERKNGEEWMVDYALRQAVSKLAPARRKKVALLVEAFETVSPIPKFESHLSHTTKLFPPPPSRSIQACS
ncbi:PREDICTED: uncharacterized protein LOC109155968 isoform X2 [Ipomoea nil]|uniref:uncharacterized protein LOC109155968 isoform X2 n=1 Tax=Ipomoea nil TaxID=35883 RepID=UPI000900D507|nr:PREDICTED: uncharacterized protein LOC109155968 isoform X2 [Ipomoea nil]